MMYGCEAWISVKLVHRKIVGKFRGVVLEENVKNTLPWTLKRSSANEDIGRKKKN